ncbi:peptidase family M48-domain-containing protein [Powellomyces hirtus]|nr:peptidase family M48-domain-containing protein [Powellomyces hirtus]
MLGTRGCLSEVISSGLRMRNSVFIGNWGACARNRVRICVHETRTKTLSLGNPTGFRCYGRGSQQYQYFANRKAQGVNPKWIIGGVAGIGSAYYLSHLDTVPITNRKRFMDVNPEQEKELSQQGYREIMLQYGHRILDPRHPYSIFVRKVARKLIRVSGLEDLHWEVHVIDDPQKNAFVLPGGKIFVFSGILPITENEDGMAAVLGHEIAHQIARHSAEKLSWVKIAMVAQTLLQFIFGYGMLTSLLLEFGLLMPFSRKMEVEADYIGLRLMAQACYDPQAAIRMWQRMQAADHKHSDLVAYMGTHPSHGSRIEKLRAWIAEAETIRANSDCYHTADLLRHFHYPRQPAW